MFVNRRFGLDSTLYIIDTKEHLRGLNYFESVLLHMRIPHDKQPKKAEEPP